jgi:predicted lipoprotein with Yx(FWY)xxD motif
MPSIGSRRTRRLLAASVAIASVAAAYGGASVGAGATAHPRRAVAGTTMNPTLDKTILVTRGGMTLYSLSAETGGRFICTDRSCLSLWTPLVVARGTTPTGVRLLATIKRPDGRTQVTYRGRPLYTFKEDRRPGDVKGNGFKDVGTWLAASGGASRPTVPPASPSPSPNPYG